MAEPTAPNQDTNNDTAKFSPREISIFGTRDVLKRNFDEIVGDREKARSFFKVDSLVARRSDTRDLIERAKDCDQVREYAEMKVRKLSSQDITGVMEMNEHLAGNKDLVNITVDGLIEVQRQMMVDMGVERSIIDSEIDHLKSVVSFVPEEMPLVKMAAALHDAGKWIAFGEAGDLKSLQAMAEHEQNLDQQQVLLRIALKAASDALSGTKAAFSDSNIDNACILAMKANMVHGKNEFPDLHMADRETVDVEVGGVSVKVSKLLSKTDKKLFKDYSSGGIFVKPDSEKDIANSVFNEDRIYSKETKSFVEEFVFAVGAADKLEGMNYKAIVKYLKGYESDIFIQPTLGALAKKMLFASFYQNYKNVPISNGDVGKMMIDSRDEVLLKAMAIYGLLTEDDPEFSARAKAPVDDKLPELNKDNNYWKVVFGEDVSEVLELLKSVKYYFKEGQTHLTAGSTKEQKMAVDQDLYFIHEEFGKLLYLVSQSVSRNLYKFDVNAMAVYKNDFSRGNLADMEIKINLTKDSWPRSFFQQLAPKES